MAILDIAILGLIFISVIVGLLRGFTKELTSIAAWVISIYLALNFYKPVSQYLTAYIKQQWLSNVAGSAIVFVGSLFILSMVGYLISKAVASTGIKGTDRVLGSVLGLVRGVLIVAVFMVIASIFNVKGTSWWNESQVVPHLLPIANAINSVLPDNFKINESTESAQPGDSSMVIDAATKIISDSASSEASSQTEK